MEKMTIGERVKLERSRRRPKMSQRDLATAADVSPLTVGRIEADVDVNLASLRSVLRALGITVEVSGDDADPNA